VPQIVVRFTKKCFQDLQRIEDEQDQHGQAMGHSIAYDIKTFLQHPFLASNQALHSVLAILVF
jgi:hypothetical protein